MSNCLFILITMTLAYRGFAQDISFPKHEDLPYLSGDISGQLNERIPVYIPMHCPENMLLYPGQGQKSTWMCDCKPKFLYFPLNHTCHEAYKQGPCPPGSHVRLPLGEVVPSCAVNPCLTDELVPFEGGCYALESNGPCGPGGKLIINPNTFQIDCEIPHFEIRPEIAAAPKIERHCPPGTRVTPTGSCKVPIE